MSDTSVRVGIIGAGSGGMAVARMLSESMDVMVFEPGLVGGECPYLACVPSKALLHDATEKEWQPALERRRELTHHFDDEAHAGELIDAGAQLVRASARIQGPGRVATDNSEHEFDHVVIATGGEPDMPQIDGIEDVADQIWTSRTAMSSAEVPDSLLIVGAGVVGVECASIYAGFGASVVLVDGDELPLPFLPERVSRRVSADLDNAGVVFRGGVEVEEFEPTEHGARARLGGGATLEADAVLIATGRRAVLTGLGLETLGISTDAALPVGPDARLRCPGSMWAVGDVIGQGEYTHLANHHAEVVADHLLGDGTRWIGDSVTPSCVFTSPPVIQVGPSSRELAADPNVIWVEASTEGLVRANTDELDEGTLCLAANKVNGQLVAAAGTGPRFDELAAALALAIDSRRSAAELARSMQPFPTVSEILGKAFRQLNDHLRSL